MQHYFDGTRRRLRSRGFCSRRAGRAPSKRCPGFRPTRSGFRQGAEGRSEMTEQNILAVDVGTSEVKAALISYRGEIRDCARSHLELLHPEPTWAEQSPDGWWRAITSAVRKLWEQVPERRDTVTGLGLLLPNVWRASCRCRWEAPDERDDLAGYAIPRTGPSDDSRFSKNLRLRLGQGAQMAPRDQWGPQSRGPGTRSPNIFG